MELTRRHLAAAGVLALGASTLIRPAVAEAGDEGAVKEATESLRKAVVAQDKAKLEALIAEQVSFGHSDGRVQNKAEFVDGVITRKATLKSLDISELQVAIVGNAAIARHLSLSESELDGKPTSTKLGALKVWQKQDGGWKLLANQNYKLA
jgi:ketosteroid isomerase-like protein